MTVRSNSSKTGAIADPLERGYPQSWYPIGFAYEVDKGAVTGKDFLGGRVIMYRDNSGKVVVQTAYCRHLGADLSLGKLVDGQIRCPFHHWQYDGRGRCSKIPTGERPPLKARLFTYPSAEAWGLVWAFNGEEPLFEVPAFPEVKESELFSQTRPGSSWPVEPWLLMSNTIDFQHLRTLHGLEPDEPQTVDYSLYTMGYDVSFFAPGLGRSTLRLRVLGTNTFTINGVQFGTEVYTMFSARPLPGGGCEGFIVSGTPRGPQGSAETEKGLAAIIEANTALVNQIMEEDRMIMSTIRFREGYLIAADRHFARFLKFVREYPRADPARAYL